jgi:outer membrane immunogenic protein
LITGATGAGGGGALTAIAGGFGGFEGGYNWQFNHQWLAGVETDFDWSHIDGTGTSNFILGSGLPAPSNFTASQNIRWFGTVRARLGYLPADNLVVYGTGGFAYGRIDENVALNSQGTPNVNNGGNSYFCFTGPNCAVGGSSRTATGWTAGGGFEYALWKNISVKAEYLYVNLGGGDNINLVLQSIPTLPPPSSFTASFTRTEFHTVRAGLNWKFN